MIQYVSNEAQFRIKYDGEDPHYHELDAALLSQALMGFSDMGRVAYRIAYPEDTHTLKVRVQALEAGSFEVVLEAIVPPLEHLYGQLIGLFNREDVEAVSNTAGVGAVIAAVFKFIKWLGGREHTATKKGDETVVKTTDGDETTVPNVVYNIAGDATFIQAAGQSLIPLEDPHYDRMDIRDSGGNTLDRTLEEDRGYFRPDSDELEYNETLTIEVAIVTAQILSPTRMWTFASGSQTFNAKVLDWEFLAYVVNDGYKFNKETRVLVDRREVRKRDASGKISTQFYIEKVRRISRPDEDPKLF